MKKTKLFFLIFLFSFFVGNLGAQTKIEGNISMTESDTISKKIVDNALYRVYYSMLFAKDSKAPAKKTECQTVLLIGAKYACFLDYNALRKDSLFDVQVKNNESTTTILSQGMSLGKMIKFKPLILKNYPQLTNYTQKEKDCELTTRKFRVRSVSNSDLYRPISSKKS